MLFRNTFLILTICFLFATKAYAVIVGSCSDVMNLGFAMDLVAYHRSEITFYPKTLPQYDETPAQRDERLSQEFRLWLAERVHQYETFSIFGPDNRQVRYNTTEIEINHLGLWHRGLFGGLRFLVAFENLYKEKIRYHLGTYLPRMSKEQNLEFKLQNHDARIQKIMGDGNQPLGFSAVHLNLKNETPDSIRGFFYYFKEASIMFRKEGKFRRLQAAKKNIEISRNGDVFVYKEYLFNLYEIVSEPSSFYAMMLQSPYGLVDAHNIVIDDEVFRPY